MRLTNRTLRRAKQKLRKPTVSFVKKKDTTKFTVAIDGDDHGYACKNEEGIKQWGEDVKKNAEVEFKSSMSS